MITKKIDRARAWASAIGAVLVVFLAGGCGGGAAPSSGSGQPADGAMTGAPASPPDALDSSLGETFKPGDSLVIGFSDIPAAEHFEEKISENGKIVLLYSESFDAAGKTRRQLENEIKARYVPKYYRRLTVTITPQFQFYFVGGDVKMPNRYQYLGKMTVLKAIQTAGDFTDFANKRKVVVTRAGGQRLVVNCAKALQDATLDVEIYPGDRIYVHRKNPFGL